MSKTFDHLIILGRPAGGKSEFIDFIKNVPAQTRAEKYRIGNFEAMDDFMWLWEKFEEDNLWEKAGRERIFSKKYGNNYGLVNGELLYFLIERFNMEVPKRYLSRPEFYQDSTLLIEFSRGGKYLYKDAISKLSKEILNRAAVLYINVSFEESWRRNVARYQEKLKHSVLSHMVPRETMDEFYSTDDWSELTKGEHSGCLYFNGLKIPFATVLNEPESTDPKVLDERYGPPLRRLFEIRQSL